MTDLISKLADSIVALINASPRSPRKEEIEQVLRDGMADKMFIVDSQSGGGFIWQTMDVSGVDVPPSRFLLEACRNHRGSYSWVPKK